MEYNYQTRKIIRTEKILKAEEKCSLAFLPCRVGSQWCMCNCPHYYEKAYLKGTFERYILCKHPDAKDNFDNPAIVDQIYEEFETRALEALCS